MEAVWQVSEWTVIERLLLAVLLGGLIGWERERDNHPAGFRTHILVSLGSALIMLISIYGFGPFLSSANVRFDPSRLSAQVVSGIGFLGAGTILRQGSSVSGLTTAASLWVAVGIGLAVGAGFRWAAVVTTVLTLVSLELLNRLEHFLFKKKSLHLIYISFCGTSGKLTEITALIALFGGSIRKLNIDENSGEDALWYLKLTINLPKEVFLPSVCERIKLIPGVKEVKF